MSALAPLLPSDPRRVGPYHLRGRLGTGGTGVVYAAVDAAGRRVAVKAVHPHLAADTEFRSRLRREVQALGRVSGPHLGVLLDADPEADVPWLATGYVAGPTLREHVSANGPLAGAQPYLLAAGTAGALAAIHAADVVHRDLKPDNVVLSPRGPHILDFGIAHLTDATAITRTGVVTGTPGWLSPEQYRGDAGGMPADVFAWGAVVAYAGTGRAPFGTGAAEAVALRVMRESPDVDALPADLRELVTSCLAKDLADRPAARVLADRTAELLGRQATQPLGPEGQGTTLVAEALATRWHMPIAEDPAWRLPTARRRTRLVAVTVAAVLAAGLGAGAGVWLASNPDRSTLPSAAAGQETTPTTTSPLSSPEPSASPTASGPTDTQVVTIAPWTVGGTPATDITITGEATGNCWSPSSQTVRLDAWSCAIDDGSVLDTCFAPDEGLEHDALLCMTSLDHTEMLRLTLTEPLPDLGAHLPEETSIEPLVIVLDDGTTCAFMGGATQTLAGERMNYACDDGGFLYGYPDRTGSIWDISYRPENASVSATTWIATVYQ
ncbi:serine/threonine-protein kinase [Streptomyces sp. B6B3]|uniref:serine/threonine-protein kinase n=1 Tax=Streptomyces sp. B6B3 TaxID=3153570 RepID=UPI00325F2F42